VSDVLLDVVIKELGAIILLLHTKPINSELDIVLRLTDLYRRLLKERDGIDGV
jgi:hypothetical protein